MRENEKEGEGEVKGREGWRKLHTASYRHRGLLFHRLHPLRGLSRAQDELQVRQKILSYARAQQR